MLKKIILLSIISYNLILPNEAEFFHTPTETAETAFFNKSCDFQKLIEGVHETQRLFARQTMYYKIYGICIGLLLFYLTRQVYLLANKPINVVHFHQLPEDYFSNYTTYNNTGNL